MTNIKGLVASEKYDEVENYIEKLDETIQTMDYKFNTGNAVTDVIINNKYQKAENAGISFQVKFNLGETDTISAFDIGIILNNLRQCHRSLRETGAGTAIYQSDFKEKESFPTD